MHLQAPLLVSGVQELLTVSCRGTEIDLQDCVAAVGEPRDDSPRVTFSLACAIRIVDMPNEGE
jgi:hypothetical protein